MQVVIVGAGPTGLTLARLLAKQGITVKLIEVARNFRRIFRGEALMPSGLEALHQMELDHLLQQIPHKPFDAWEFYIENRSIFRVEEPMETNGLPCTQVSQPALLTAILQEISELPNFEFIQGVAVKDLQWQGDALHPGVANRISGVKLSDGSEISADLVIGADGRNSVVRERMKLFLEKDSSSFDILWFKLPVNSKFTQENIFYTFVSGGEAFGLFQGSEGQLQLGWSLDQDSPIDWQNLDWQAKFAAASPDWLAAYFRELKEPIARPILLSITVGRCPRWWLPGGLILGDAAHPMSPIRAQGINMALRDVLVTANYLIPRLQRSPSAWHSQSQNAHSITADIDAILPQIQAEREPEIRQIQRLQRQESAQGELMRNHFLIRQAISRLAPLLGSLIKKSWLTRQHQLRQGITSVKLEI